MSRRPVCMGEFRAQDPRAESCLKDVDGGSFFVAEVYKYVMILDFKYIYIYTYTICMLFLKAPCVSLYIVLLFFIGLNRKFRNWSVWSFEFEEMHPEIVGKNYHLFGISWTKQCCNARFGLLPQVMEMHLLDVFHEVAPQPGVTKLSVLVETSPSHISSTTTCM